MYDSVCHFCFRYLKFTSFDKVDLLTIPEYLLLVDVYKDELEELEYDRHWRAYLAMAAQATVQRGKKQRMKYPTFDKFYDRKAVKDAIHGKVKKTDEMSERIKKYRLKKRGDI